MKHLFLFFSSLALILTTRAQDSEPVKPNEEIIFQSGFELDSKVVARGSEADITGIDLSVPHQNDWTKSFDDHPDVGNFSLQYQGGDSSQRFA